MSFYTAWVQGQDAGASAGNLRQRQHVTAGAATLLVRNPNWQFVFDTETRRKFYDMAAAERALIQGYHFTFPSRGYIEKSGSGYRFVPAPWIPTL